MDIAGSHPLVTGATRGIGRAFVDAFLEAGAAKVYAGARTEAAAAAMAAIDPRVQPLLLDVVNPEQIAQAASRATDVDILVNNAGILHYADFLSEQCIEATREEFAVNYFGPLMMARAFHPALAANGGAIANVLSIAALTYVPVAGTYNASKAAARSMTHGLRHELAGSGVRVLAVYAGGYDTEMHPPGVDLTLLHPPRMLTSAVLTALRDGGEDEVYPDPSSAAVRSMGGALLNG